MANLSVIQGISLNINTRSFTDNHTIINSALSTNRHQHIINCKLSRFPYEIINEILINTDLQTSINFSSLCRRFRQIGIPFQFIQQILIDKDFTLFKSSSFLEYLYHYYTKPSFINYLINHYHHCPFLCNKNHLKNIYDYVKFNQSRFSDFSFNNNCCIIRAAEIGDVRLFRFFLSQDPYHYPILLRTFYSDLMMISKWNNEKYNNYSNGKEEKEEKEEEEEEKITNESIKTIYGMNPLFPSLQNSMLWDSSNDKVMESNNIFNSLSINPYTLYQQSNHLPNSINYDNSNNPHYCRYCGLIKFFDNSASSSSSSSFNSYICHCKFEGVINIMYPNKFDNGEIDENIEKFKNVSINNEINLRNHCSIPGCNCHFYQEKNDECRKQEEDEENDIIHLYKGRHICINISDRNDRAFCQACANGHIEIVKILLSITHPKLVNTQAHNNYAIINAASNGHVEVVKLLLSLKDDRKVDITANDHAAFVWACCYGHIDVVNELLKEPNINTQAQNNSAIIWACNNGKLEVVKLLLSLKGKLAIDPTAQNNRAIVSACSMGFIEIVKALLEYGEEEEEENNNKESIQKVKVDPTVNNNQAFITACSNGSLEIIKMLLALKGEKAINPVDQNNEAFINACTNGHQEIAELLLGLKGKYEVDPSAQDNKAFVRACSYGNLNIIRMLLSLPLSKGIDPTAQQNLAFINACLCGYYDLIKELLTLSDIDYDCIENYTNNYDYDHENNKTINSNTCSDLVCSLSSSINPESCYNHHKNELINGDSSSTSSLTSSECQIEDEDQTDIYSSSCNNHSDNVIYSDQMKINSNNNVNEITGTNNLSDESSNENNNIVINDKVKQHKILKPINPNDRDNQAFIEACSYGHEKVVKLLLSLKGKYRVDPSSQNCQALIKSAINGHQNVVKLILSIEDDRKINKKDPIETAIRLVNDYKYKQKQNYQNILLYLKNYLTKIS